jgi:hypothetical protein
VCGMVFYEQRLDYESILSRSERATAHDEEPPIRFDSNTAHEEDFSISFQKRKEIRATARPDLDKIDS